MPDHMQPSFRMEDFHQFWAQVPPVEEQVANLENTSSKRTKPALSSKLKSVLLLSFSKNAAQPSSPPQLLARSMSEVWWKLRLASSDYNPKDHQIFLPSGEPHGIRIAEITTRIVQVIEVP